MSENTIIEGKEVSFMTSNDYLHGEELSVTITLAEYRDLLTSRADLQGRLAAERHHSDKLTAELEDTADAIQNRLAVIEHSLAELVQMVYDNSHQDDLK